MTRRGPSRSSGTRQATAADDLRAEYPRRTTALAGQLVDAYDLCGLAGRTVTRAYRAGIPKAHALDGAHARLWKRTHARGTLPADDPDVMLIFDAANALDDEDREHALARTGPYPTTIE